jgi:hypothetical protein
MTNDKRRAALKSIGSSVTDAEADSLALALTAYLIGRDDSLAEAIANLVSGISTDYNYGCLAAPAAAFLHAKYGKGDCDTIVAIIGAAIHLTAARIIETPSLMNSLLAEAQA